MTKKKPEEPSLRYYFRVANLAKNFTLLFAAWQEVTSAELGFDFRKLYGKHGPLVSIVPNVNIDGYDV